MSKVLTRARRDRSFGPRGSVPVPMNSLTRFVGLLVLLLLIFLAAALLMQRWLHRQGEQLRAEAVQSRRAQLETALRLSPVKTPPDTPLLRDLGELVRGTVEFETSPSVVSASAAPGMLSFTHPASGGTLRVTFPAPPTVRLLRLHQGLTAGLLLLGVAFATVFGLATFGSGRRGENDGGSRPPWRSSRAEMASLEHLAKTSVEQSVALAHERDVRLRAEQDAQLHQQLTSRALDGQARLGRDLHDGIIQSLYAVGLTLESLRTVNRTDPVEAERRLAQSLEALNGIIRDVRAYITGLAPESLRQASFAQALATLVEELRAGREVTFDLRLDEDATALLTAEQSTEALQIAREAISNALRHGHATAVSVRLHQSDREICLLVQDNGAGFDPERRSDGHGLGNMRARASRLGASVRLQSRAGEGTRVILTLPVFQSA